MAKTRAETPRQKPDYGQRLNRIRQSAQIGYHLNRAMDNGLSVEEAGEIVTQPPSMLAGQTHLPLLGCGRGAKQSIIE